MFRWKLYIKTFNWLLYLLFITQFVLRLVNCLFQSWVLHTVRSGASPFKVQYLIFSFRSSSSCLYLLRRFFPFYLSFNKVFQRPVPAQGVLHKSIIPTVRDIRLIQSNGRCSDDQRCFSCRRNTYVLHHSIEASSETHPLWSNGWKEKFNKSAYRSVFWVTAQPRLVKHRRFGATVFPIVEGQVFLDNYTWR